MAVRNRADMSTFYKCSFKEDQDTFYIYIYISIYRGCLVSYLVTQQLFSRIAKIYPRLPLDKQCTAITAQGGVDPNQSTGTWIHDCVIKAADGTGR